MRDLLICNPAAKPKHFRINNVPTIVSHAAAITRKNERKFAKYYLEEIQKRKYRDLLQLKIDVIIPVPIHRKKRRKRGFNQAEIFANGIAEMLNKPMYTKIVERIHDTKPQKQLNTSAERPRSVSAIKKSSGGICPPSVRFGQNSKIRDYNR
mgnify:CR=1 FL=1